MQTYDRDDIQAWKLEHWPNRQWKKTLTFVTPLDGLDWYVPALMECMPAFDSALVQAEPVMPSNPKTLAVMTELGIGSELDQLGGYLCESQETARKLFSAFIDDCYDVTLMPQPAQWCLTADHDEYTTVFASKPGKLSDLRGILIERSVKIVDGYTHNPPMKNGSTSIKP